MLSALIIAAGRGTRLKPYTEERPKSLFEIAPGKTIISFILDRLERAGFREVYIVTRPEYKRAFEEEVGDRARVVELEGPEEFGNLYPVLWAVESLGLERFLLLMSDHIFEYEMLARLVSSRPDKAFVVCLDRNPSWDKAVEGLKLKLGGEGVRDVGKELPPIHGIDTGLILCAESAREYVKRAYGELGPRAAVGDALKLAAAEGEVGCVDVSGLLWMDVDTPEDLAKARKMYWEILRRELVKPSDGVVSRYLNRPLSTRISLWLYRKGYWIDPNLVSVLAFALALVASYLIYAGWHIAAALLVHASSVIDGVDGELARLTGKTSKLGGAFETLLDRIADLAVVISLGAIYAGPFREILVPLAAAGVVLVSYASKVGSDAGLDISRLRLLPPYATRDVRLFVVTLALLLGYPWIALYYLAATPYIFASYVLVGLTPKFRGLEVRKVEREPLPVITLREDRLKSQIKSNVESLIVNMVKLAVGIVVVSSIAPYVPVMYFDLEYFAISTKMIAPAVCGLITIYYGYRVLQSLKFFLEIASEVLAEKLWITGSACRALALNTLYVVVLILVWHAIAPIAASAPEQLKPAFFATSLAILAMVLILGYRLFTTARRSLAGHWERAIGALVERITREYRGLRKGKGSSGEKSERTS